MSKSIIYIISLSIILMFIVSITTANQNDNFKEAGEKYLTIVDKLQASRDIMYSDSYIASSMLRSCIELSKQSNEDSLLYVSRKLYAISFSFRNQLDSALILSQSLINDIPKDKYFQTQASVYNYLGSIYGRNNDLDKALEFLLVADSIAAIPNDKVLKLSILNNIANIQLQNNNLQKAIKSYKSALTLAKSEHANSESIWRLTNNIILSHANAKQLDSARVYFYQFLPIENEPAVDKSETIINYAYAFMIQKKLDSALYFVEMAYDSLKQSNKSTKNRIDISKANILLQTTQEERYIDTLLAKINVPNFSEILQVERSVYEEIYNYYQKHGNYKKAFQYYQKYVSLNDSIIAKSNSAKIKAIEFNLKYHKLQNQIEQKNKQINRQESKEVLLLVILGSLFIFITITVSIGFYRKKIIAVLASQKKEISNQYNLLDEKNQLLEIQNHEIESMLDDLKQSKEYLEKLNKQKDTFVSIFTHQLTNQVQAILMSAEALHLDKNKSPEFVDKFSEILYNASNHLRNMLANFMEWARTQTEHIKANPVHFDLQELIDRQIASNQQILLNKNIEVIKACQKQMVFADKTMIDTVFKNVISNAIKYSFEGGKIEFSCTEEETSIVTFVRDYGTGIEDTIVEKLFNIDTRVATKGTMGEQGSGLGLSICKELLKLNFGEIEIESKKGKGTLVKIQIPTSNSD